MDVRAERCGLNIQHEYVFGPMSTIRIHLRLQTFCKFYQKMQIQTERCCKRGRTKSTRLLGRFSPTEGERERSSEAVGDASHLRLDGRKVCKETHEN